MHESGPIVFLHEAMEDVLPLIRSLKDSPISPEQPPGAREGPASWTVQSDLGNGSAFAAIVPSRTPTYGIFRSLS